MKKQHLKVFHFTGEISTKSFYKFKKITFFKRSMRMVRNGGNAAFLGQFSPIHPNETAPLGWHARGTRRTTSHFLYPVDCGRKNKKSGK